MKSLFNTSFRLIHYKTKYIIPTLLHGNSWEMRQPEEKTEYRNREVKAEVKQKLKLKTPQQKTNFLERVKAPVKITKIPGDREYLLEASARALEATCWDLASKPYRSPASPVEDSESTHQHCNNWL